MTKKVVVIGFDGATFDVLKPLVEKGKLPNLFRMLTEGANGKLRSTTPPLTGPAWVSFATGKNPGNHGCYTFESFEKSIEETRTITTAKILGKTFYELLDSSGKKCVIINLPCSYPPRIKGDLVTSFLTVGPDHVFPKTLENEVPGLKDYRKPYKQGRR